VTQADLAVAAAPRGTAVAARGMVLVMAALLLSQFVGNVNATVVTTALPTIIDSLGGTTVQYSWVMTATVLGLTTSTPIWSRLADVRNPKTLMQVGIGVFVVGAVAAGFAQSAEMLIVARAVTGIGLGGMISLVQVILAVLVAPRVRGRYTAWLSAVQLVAMLCGPVIGGLLVDTAGLGWRWCFLVGVPIAIAAGIVLQVTLKLTARGGRAEIDYAGAILLAIGVPLLLGWASLVQGTIDLVSWPSLLLGGGGAIVLVAAAVVELRVRRPIVPIRLFARRVPLLSMIASLSVGCTMFGGSIFLSQYLQYGRGLTPTGSGLLLVTMAIGTVASSFVVGWIVSRTGRLKAALVAGMSLLLIATALLATLSPDTPLALVGLFLLIDGVGLGATAQYLVLGVQNTVGVDQVGATSGAVSFFRSLGGSLTLAALGGFLGVRLGQLQADGHSVAQSYGLGVPDVFLVTAAATIPGLVAIALLPRIRLRETIDLPPAVPDRELG
jgi:MFS family permease